MPKDTRSIFPQEELIQAIQTNQSDVLAMLYTEVFPKVRGYILQNSGDEDQAKDIFQEAFIVGWEQVKSGDFEPKNASAFQGFLFQVAKNKWLDWLRSSRYKKEISLDGFGQNVAQEEEEEEIEIKYKQLKAAFSELGEGCQDLLNRFYFKKESLTELAQSNSWTAQTAKNNKYRCMEKLRKIIQK